MGVEAGHMIGFIRKLLRREHIPLTHPDIEWSGKLWGGTWDDYPTNVDRILHEDGFMYAILGTGEIMSYDGQNWKTAESHRSRCRKCRKLLEPHVCI